MHDVPGWFLLFFWGNTEAGAAVDEAAVEDWCCVIWLWFSCLISKKGVDEEEAAMFLLSCKSGISQICHNIYIVWIETIKYIVNN